MALNVSFGLDTPHNCAHCGAPFTAQRVTRRFCSPACRLAAMRHRQRELEARDSDENATRQRERADDSQAEAPRTLDRSRDYAEVHGHPQGYAFEQDNILFRSDGTEADRE